MQLFVNSISNHFVNYDSKIKHIIYIYIQTYVNKRKLKFAERTYMKNFTLELESLSLAKSQQKVEVHLFSGQILKNVNIFRKNGHMYFLTFSVVELLIKCHFQIIIHLVGSGSRDRDLLVSFGHVVSRIPN